MRLIDAHDVLGKIEMMETADVVDVVESIIMSQTVDAVPVIRCKDCKYYYKSDEECQLIKTRLHFYETNKRWTEDSFCSWAEREEDETD